MSAEVWVALLNLIPPLLWFLLLAGLLFFFRDRLQDMFTRLSTFEAMGVKVVCMRESIDAAIELAEKSPKWKVDIAPADKRRVLARARASYTLIKGTQILWVDDEPENSLNERRMFRQLDVDIDNALDNDKALTMLASAGYDLIFSDIARPGQSGSGIDLARAVHERHPDIPVILYVGDYRPDLGVPPYTFGVTNRPDELLHLTLDALARLRDAS